MNCSGDEQAPGGREGSAVGLYWLAAWGGPRGRRLAKLVGAGGLFFPLHPLDNPIYTPLFFPGILLLPWELCSQLCFIGFWRNPFLFFFNLIPRLGAGSCGETGSSGEL